MSIIVDFGKPSVKTFKSATGKLLLVYKFSLQELTGETHALNVMGNSGDSNSMVEESFCVILACILQSHFVKA